LGKHPDKGYEIGTLEEAEKFRKMRNGDPVKHCEVYKEIGCAHVDGYLCDMGTCGIREKFLNGTLEYLKKFDWESAVKNINSPADPMGKFPVSYSTSEKNFSNP
jgi:hypothetical protein